MADYLLSKAEAYAVMAMAEKRQRLLNDAQEASMQLQALCGEMAQAKGIDTEKVDVDFEAKGDNIVITLKPKPEPEVEPIVETDA
jgi:hypothetical protein